jgi:hypothetical protein
MKKKILSVVLAMTMVMGLSITAFADTVVGNQDGADATASAGTTLTTQSTTNLPVIKITVPTVAAVVINPFQLSYKDTEAGIEGSDSVVSVLKKITSDSNVPVAVNVENFKATPTEGVAIVSKSAVAAKAKSAYIYMAIGEDVNAAKKFTTLVATNPTGEATGAEKAAIYVLPAKETTATECQFIIRGDVNANPVNGTTGAADPWAATDKVTISYKFTFTPQIAK